MAVLFFRKAFKLFKIPRIVLLLLLFFAGKPVTAQLPYDFIDGTHHRYCTGCVQVINSMPREVMFGIQVNDNGDIYFSMSNIAWFDKVFKNNSYGVTIDIVAKSRYGCNKDLGEKAFTLPRGTMIKPVYRPELLNMMDELRPGHIFVKVGKVPAALAKQQLEGNLVILNGNYICYYSSLINIPRSGFELLPMGLFTDSLLQETKTGVNGQKDFFTYTSKIKIEAPFTKSGTTFSDSYVRSLYDSLELGKYRIKKIDIRAYASVEGPEKTNIDLMKKRAEAMVMALKRFQPGMKRIKISTAENWLEFYNDIPSTGFADFADLSKIEIKQKLVDTSISAKLEPMLAKHRKVMATLYLETKDSSATIADTAILSAFQQAVAARDINKARLMQKELVERIMDNQLPVNYMDRVEVPRTKAFSPLLNDREVYRYLLKATTEYEALENFLAIRQLDPANGRVNYNICALRFFAWRYGADTASARSVLEEINALPKQGIAPNLVKRMLINYYILKSEDQEAVFNYKGKDSSLSRIRELYETQELNDEDIYSLAKYYAYYSHFDWAEEIVKPRVDKIEVEEDLLFYYINLLFFHAAYESEDFKKAVINGIGINPVRFCNFFLPSDRGGASMQLLEYEILKSYYCETCK